MRFAPQRCAIFRHLKFKKWSEHVVFCAFWLANVLLRATAACHFWKSEERELLWTWDVLYILTCKCASRRSGVPFLDIGTAKIGLALRCFVHFDLQICFAPQQPAIFGHRKSKNCSYNFSTSELPTLTYFAHFHLKMCFGPQRRAFSFLCWTATSAPAALASLLFEHRETTNHSKNKAIRDFPKMWRMCSFFLETLLACWSSLFWLDFSGPLFNCPYCRKLDF